MVTSEKYMSYFRNLGHNWHHSDDGGDAFSRNVGSYNHIPEEGILHIRRIRHRWIKVKSHKIILYGTNLDNISQIYAVRGEFRIYLSNSRITH